MAGWVQVQGGQGGKLTNLRPRAKGGRLHALIARSALMQFSDAGKKKGESKKQRPPRRGEENGGLLPSDGERQKEEEGE